MCTIQPCQILSVLPYWFLPFLLSFLFLSSLFPLLSSLPPSLIPSLPPFLLYFLPSLSFSSFLSPSFWKKENTTQSFLPRLWAHHQPSTFSNALPIRGNRVPGPGAESGWIIGLARLVLPFTVFPWPIPVQNSGLPQKAFYGPAPPPPWPHLPLIFPSRPSLVTFV